MFGGTGSLVVSSLRVEINGFFVMLEAYSSNLVHGSVPEAPEFSVSSIESLKKLIF